jgi:hypothetical protein
VISNGRLYVAGSLLRQSSMEGRIYCFDLTGADGPRGRLLWSHKLSGVTAIMDWWSISTSLRESATIAISGGRLFINSNHGSVVCLDAEDGRPYWVTAYRLRGNQRDMSFARFYRNRNTYTPVMRPEAPVLYGTTVIAAPVDGVAGLSLDLATGVSLATTLDRDRKFETSPYFIGVHRGRSYFLTTEGVVSEAATFGRILPDGRGGFVPGSMVSSTGLDTEGMLGGIAPLLVPGMGEHGAVLVAHINGVAVLDASSLRQVKMLPWPDAPAEWLASATDAKAEGRPTSEAELESLRRLTIARLKRTLGGLSLRNGPDGLELGLLTPGRLVHFRLLDN